MCHVRAAVYALALALLGLAGRPAAAQVFARADDTRATPPEYRPRRPLRVELSGGATFLTGNVDHLALAGKLALGLRLAERHELFLDGAATHTMFNGSTVIDKDSGALMYVFALVKHWNLFALSTHSRNRFLQLDYRTTNTAGLCLHSFGPAALTPLLVSVGLTPEFELWPAPAGSAAAGSESVFALRASARLSFTWLATKALNVGFDLIYTPALADPADFRLYLESYVQLKLTSELLSLRLAATDEYDSRPRAGVRRNDLSLLPTLVVTFPQSPR